MTKMMDFGVGSKWGSVHMHVLKTLYYGLQNEAFSIEFGLFMLELGPSPYNTCMSTHTLFEGLRGSPLDREFPSLVGHMDVSFPQETKV